MPAPVRAARAPIAHASTRSVPSNGGRSQSVPDAAVRPWLLAHASGRANDAIIASMLASQRAGLGAMPDWLGLTPEAFQALIADHFPALRQHAFPQPGRGLDPARAEERDELVRLLLGSCEEPSQHQRWMAGIIAAGCMGSDHLWQDLGLGQRAELSVLMTHNFPALAEKNHRDMKWKRFLYKQLCETEGIYTCRSPSCEVCVDYHACFGPEN